MVRIMTAIAAAAALFLFPVEKLHAENILETEEGVKGTIVDLVTGEPTHCLSTKAATTCPYPI